MTHPSLIGPFIHPMRMDFLEAVSRLIATNPFEPAWNELLKAALRDRYVPEDGGAWPRDGGPSKNLERITDPLGMALAVGAHGLASGAATTPREIAAYQGAAIYYLWDEFGPGFQRIIDSNGVDAPFYDEFVERYRYLLGYPGISAPDPGDLMSFFYQARRTWYFARSKIRGASPSAEAARAAIWRASMGSDIWVYVGGLYRRMHEIPVLITGETGTGKELAAECVGWSRYIPFDTKTRRFALRYAADYHVRSICEVPRELVESALFGHRKGSFTGAGADTIGCFALPGQYGTLFLDEIGELLEHVQAKLLRPLQNREYVPIGETRPRDLQGRHLFATHRDLEALCLEGKFRADLYERLNGVPIHMPSLRQMIREAPDEMRHYVRGVIAEKVDDPARVEAWTERVVNAIAATRFDYLWPRNLRELKNYTERYLLTDGRMSAPASPAVAESRPAAAPTPPPQETATPASTCVPSSGILGPVAKEGQISIDELTRAYVTLVYVLTGQNLAETARRTGLDRRTVRRLIDPVRLARWLSRRQ